jgi:hypothetical protein
MLLLGLLTRRLWAIPVGAVGWGVLVLSVGTAGIGEFPIAALLGGANMAVGVLVRRAAAWPLRRVGSARPRSVS